MEGERWDNYFRFPPCTIVAEIERTRAMVPDRQDLEYLTILCTLIVEAMWCLPEEAAC
jgi:hypothetical protein